MVNYKGTIWATWDKDAPSFFAYLGDMRYFLDTALDHRDGREGGSEVIGGVNKWRMPCNWKFAAENFTGDRRHTISHQSMEIVGIGPGGPGQSRQGVVNPGDRPREGHMDAPRHRLGLLPGVGSRHAGAGDAASNDARRYSS